MREFELLEHVFVANRLLSQRVSIPPGDDMGAVRIGEHDVLITVDQVADGVHFDLSRTPLEKVARKAITRNLSDVAAMAAVPMAAVAAVCLPADFTQARATQLFDAMRLTAGHYDCPLVGGDVSVWEHPLLISVTILAETRGLAPVLRRGAQVGDVIFVSGHLGGSLIEHEGHTHHLDFEPRLALARQLAGDGDTRPHCMIDLSDGLARDLGHLCRAAGLRARIDADHLPISGAARALAHRDGQPPWKHAVADGEDYELCFTMAPAQAERGLPARIDGVPITRIGIMVPPHGPPGVSLRLPDGSVADLDNLGWEHRIPSSQ